jgi:hypothetical protein
MEENITKTTPYLAVLFPTFNASQVLSISMACCEGQSTKQSPWRVKTTLKLDSLELTSYAWHCKLKKEIEIV